MSSNPTLAFRVAAITRLLADATVAGFVGTRVWDTPPPESDPHFAYPFLLVSARQMNDDTHSERGATLTIMIHVEGEKGGRKQGEEIFAAVLDSFRSWPRPAALSGHSLANLVFTDEAVVMAEDGKRYAGLQQWRGVTEES